uniref:nodulation protein NodZ n=1 Tax=Calothrix rhizosoleniae TaxID=888997 RepID=UPI000B4A344E
MTKNKFLLIKSQAGMGNRILNLLGSILYSQITQRTIIVDWSDEVYSDDYSNVFPQLFTLKNIDQETEIPDTDSVFPYIWKTNLHKTIGATLRENNLPNEGWFTRNPVTWSVSRVKFSCTNRQEDVLVNWSYFSDINQMRKSLIGEFKSFSYLDEKTIQKHICKKHLFVDKEVVKRVDYFKNKYFNQKNIGVHIRCTDRRNPFDKYLEIIDNIVRNDSEICIFLATDNYHVQNHLKKIYGERVVFQQKWFPKTDSTIDRLHFNPDCPDKLENAFQALVL